jgi:hypothetical protein
MTTTNRVAPSRSELAHLACVAALFVTAGVAWPFAPEAMPVHWNLAGQVDRYGGRAEGLRCSVSCRKSTPAVRTTRSSARPTRTCVGR